MESIVVAGPEGTQNLCLDKGYDNPTGHGTVAAAVRISGALGRRSWTTGRENLSRPTGTHPSWLSKCRGILVRYDKKPTNYLGQYLRL